MTNAAILQFELIFFIKHVRTKRQNAFRKFENTFRIDLQNQRLIFKFNTEKQIMLKRHALFKIMTRNIHFDHV